MTQYGDSDPQRNPYGQGYYPYGGGGYGPPPPAPPPVPPPKRGLGTGAVIGIVSAVAAVLLLCGAGVFGVLWFNQASPNGDPPPVPPVSTPPQAPPTTPPAPPPSTPPSTPAGPIYNVPPNLAKVGECVRLTGKTGIKEDAVLTTPCKSGVLRIMKRFDYTSSVGKCGSTHEKTYYRQMPGMNWSYVLCLNTVP